MTITSMASGHPIEFDGTAWRFRDTGHVVDNNRACAHCALEPVLVKLHRTAGQLHSVPVVVNVDACIAPIVQALNDGGIETKASCCGHSRIPGRIMLQDGRDLVLLANADQFFAGQQVDTNRQDGVRV